jgi:hypothetical protein
VPKQDRRMTALQIMRTDQQLIDGLRDSDPSAVEELISLYLQSLRALLRRSSVSEEEMGLLIGDIVITTVERVRSGVLNDPKALPAFFWSVARQRVAIHKVQTRRTPLDTKLVRRAEAVLASMPRRDREVLVRYYLGEQNPEQICRTFQLTAEQWRLMKSRAKTMFRLGERKSAGQSRVIPLPRNTERCVA